MAGKMKQKEFIETLWLEYEQKTLYANGAFGAPLTQRAKDRYHVSAPVDPSVFLFDCCGTQKAALWGYRADSSAVYGGAEYKKDEIYCYRNEKGELCEYNDNVINGCYDVSTDFTKIDPGECVWIPGHVGTYVGNGLVIECTAAWDGCVQLTACNRDIEGFHRRNWQKHGKLPWVEYGEYIEPVFTYQTFDLPREKWQPLVTNLKDYAGVFGDAVGAFRATPSIGKLEYWSRSDPENWSGGTYNGSTSGTMKHALVAIMARYDKSRAHYRVKAGGVWLPTVSGCDPGDAEKGYAGDDKNAIEAIYIWADPIFQEDEPEPQEPPQNDENAVDPGNDTPTDEMPAEREKTALPAWFYDFLARFCEDFNSNFERLGDNSEKEDEK